VARLPWRQRYLQRWRWPGGLPINQREHHCAAHRQPSVRDLHIAWPSRSCGSSIMRTNRPHCFALAAAMSLVALTMATSASAQVPRGPAFKLDPSLDLPILLIAGATASSFFFLPESPSRPCPLPCERSRINRFDRAAAGRYDPTWSTVGDIATASTLAMPLVALVLGEGVKDGLTDTVVVAEAALVSSALQVSISYAVARPRPRVYSNEAPIEERNDANAARSFFSGHVANTVATSVAALRAFQRLGKPALGWSVLGIGLAGSSLVGVARVASGAHFPSDVAVGAAVGTALGLALPAVHDSGVQIVPLGDRRGGGLVVIGAFD
jgi:membrane-associated phospholipid phosphatase